MILSVLFQHIPVLRHIRKLFTLSSSIFDMGKFETQPLRLKHVDPSQVKQQLKESTLLTVQQVLTLFVKSWPRN